MNEQDHSELALRGAIAAYIEENREVIVDAWLRREPIDPKTLTLYSDRLNDIVEAVADQCVMRVSVDEEGVWYSVRHVWEINNRCWVDHRPYHPIADQLEGWVRQDRKFAAWLAEIANQMTAPERTQ